MPNVYVLRVVLPIAAVLSTLMTSAALGQLPIRLGSEFQVNTYTPNFQSSPDVAMRSDGEFVVAWQSDGGQDGSVAGVFARRFDSSGASIAGEFRVNTYTTSGQGLPAVAREPDGDFVVVWSSSGQDGNSAGVFGQRFNAAGVAQGAEFRVNSYTSGAQTYPAISIDADGDFVVAWHSSSGQDGGLFGIFARRFNASAVGQGVEFQVNLHTTDSQTNPAVALASSGNFVIAWNSTNQDGSSLGVFARRFSATGTAQGAELQVNTYTSGVQISPSVGFDGGGGFVIAWGSQGQNGSLDYEVFARRFASNGTAQGVEFQINSYTPGNQYVPDLAVGADGDFVVAWQSEDSDGGDYGVFARAFSSTGVALSADFQANSYTTNSQYYPAVALDAGGRFVVAWHSLGQDEAGVGRAVAAQRFATPAVLDIDANGEVAPLKDGILVLRYLFGFDGAALISGAFDAQGCNRCTAPAMEAYLATLI